MRVTILRGVPGSGKSTYGRRLSESQEICSADHFFEADGVYRFDAKKLGEAHRACLGKYLNLLQTAVPNVVVDNTNLILRHMAPYIALAELFRYDIEIVEFPCTAAESAARNIHGVPLASIEGMLSRFERLPKEWNRFQVTGWDFPAPPCEKCGFWRALGPGMVGCHCRCGSPVVKCFCKAA